MASQNGWSWRWLGQRLPLLLLPMFLIVIALIAGMFTPLFLARLGSTTMPVVLTQSGVGGWGLRLLGTAAAFWTVVGAIFAVFSQFWIPWCLTLFFVGLVAQVLTLQGRRIPWFYVGIISLGLSFLILCLGLFFPPAFDLVLPLIGFPIGMATLALIHELHHTGLTGAWSLAITLMTMIFAGVVGAMVISWLFGLTAIGVPMGEPGHSLALVLMPYGAVLGLAWCGLIFLALGYYPFRSRRGRA